MLTGKDLVKKRQKSSNLKRYFEISREKFSKSIKCRTRFILSMNILSNPKHYKRNSDFSDFGS